MVDNSVEKQWNCFGWKMNRNFVKRYFAMANICLLGLGIFICYDSVGALQHALMEKFQISFSEFSLMYSVNAWANIVVSPFGGFLIDRLFGIRFGTLFYGLMFFVGHLLFASGVSIASFWLGLLGRLVNGVGHEFIFVCLQIYSVYYFKGKELSLIMCTNISIARLGTSIVYALSEPLLIHVRQTVPGTHDVGLVVFIVGSFMLLTMGSAIALMIMTPKNITPAPPSQQKLDETKPRNLHPKINLKDLINWPLEYWIISCLMLSSTVAIYVFLPFTQELFMTVNGLTIEESNSVTSFFNILGAAISPVVGIIVDKIGREIYFCQFGFLLTFIAHALVGFSDCSPYISMSLMSFSFAIFNASVMPMLPLIVPEYKLGSAYGVSLTYCNAIFALCMYLCGLTVDTFSYVGLAVFMLVVVGVGFVAGIILLFIDRKRNGILNISSVDRKAILKRENAKENKEATEPLKN